MKNVRSSQALELMDGKVSLIRSDVISQYLINYFDQERISLLFPS